MSNKRDNHVAGDEDYELVCLSQRGDVNPFGALVEKHQKEMVNISYRMLGDYEGAGDVFRRICLLRTA
jgi:DNA-directed RNA polymerase specialized sigma24 family protein